VISMSETKLKEQRRSLAIYRLSWARERAATAVLVVAFGLTARADCFQEVKAAGDPAFEVVSVKSAGTLGSFQAADGRSYLNVKPFRYTGESVTATQPLSTIIKEAYSLQDWELDSPNWTHTLIFELSARMPQGTSRVTARLMLQQMLAERFGFKFRRENRQIAVYALVQGKGSAKLIEASQSEQLATRMRAGEFVGANTLDQMAYIFLNYTDKPVVNDRPQRYISH
jgi:uncharacterized protein (TIGR03435 family)